MTPPELDFDAPPSEDDEPKQRSERSLRRDRAKQRAKRGDISTRLEAIFARLADSLDGRGDAELAGMIREDTAAMVGGLVSLMGRVPAAAGGIVAGLAVLEPLIAFGRILRLLVRRGAERRYDDEPGPSYPPEEDRQMPGFDPANIAGGDDEPVIAEPWRLDT